MTLHIDVYEPEQYVAGPPHEKFEVLRAQAPVFRHVDPQREDGHWAVTRHADVVAISRNPEVFSSYERTALMPEWPPEQVEQLRLLMLNQDPPEHTRTRSLVNRGFTPRMIGRLEERVRQVCDETVDAAVAKGEGDFVTMCAAELPLVVIAELMGVPHADRHKVFEWSNRMVGYDDPELATTPEDGQQASMELFAYANELAAQKKQQLKDDIVSKLISPDDEGNVLSEFEFDMFFLLLAVAGNETTRNAISGGMLAFADHPDQWQRLRADLDLLPSAADEVVRWVSPVNVFRRTPRQDVEVGGQQIKAGEKVCIYYSSANRDESVFERPQDFDIGRDPNPHVGFGGGGPPPRPGRPPPPLEIECIFRSLATKCERVELVGPARRLRSSFLNGIKEMSVRFVPAGAAG